MQFIPRFVEPGFPGGWKTHGLREPSCGLHCRWLAGDRIGLFHPGWALVTVVGELVPGPSDRSGSGLSLDSLVTA
jgi:hypothetical protein